MNLSRINRVAGILTNLFALWVILAAAAAFVWPGGFVWFQRFIVPAMGVIMFGMGITLTVDDFKRVAEKPRAVGVGVFTQYAIMPFWGAAAAKILALPAPLAAGVILVGACPGGTASNVMTYLAKGDVALSRRHFADVLVALPSAIFSVWHNITGPVVATYWSRKLKEV
jgi:BASS family bile acid:Na+ symporter